MERDGKRCVFAYQWAKTVFISKTLWLRSNSFKRNFADFQLALCHCSMGGTCRWTSGGWRKTIGRVLAVGERGARVLAAAVTKTVENLQSLTFISPSSSSESNNRWGKCVWSQQSSVAPYYAKLSLFTGPIKCEGFDQIPLVTVHCSNILFHWGIRHSTEAKDALTSVSLGRSQLIQRPPTLNHQHSLLRVMMYLLTLTVTHVPVS